MMDDAFIRNAVFTLIAYKPDSTEICMGNVMGSYSSDLKMLNRLSFDQLAEELVTIGEYPYDEQEAKYEVYTLVNGCPITESVYPDVTKRLKLRMESILSDRAEDRERERVQAAEEAATQAAKDQQAALETARQQELNQFFALGQKLGFNVTPNTET